MSTRSRLNEQLNKLQAKHNAEVDLLEDLKQFTRQRSILEKQYSEVSLVSWSVLYFKYFVVCVRGKGGVGM